MIHCKNEVATAKTAIFHKKIFNPSNSTFPGATIKSILFPTKIGRYKVIATVKSARIQDNITQIRYLFI